MGNALTPVTEVDAPSTLAKAGDLDRFGEAGGPQAWYGIVLPVNTTDGDGKTTCGSYQLSNAWPDRLSAEQTVYVVYPLWRYRRCSSSRWIAS